jgi:hypothetical protein
MSMSKVAKKQTPSGSQAAPFVPLVAVRGDRSTAGVAGSAWQMVSLSLFVVLAASLVRPRCGVRRRVRGVR